MHAELLLNTLFIYIHVGFSLGCSTFRQEEVKL